VTRFALLLLLDAEGDGSPPVLVFREDPALFVGKGVAGGKSVSLFFSLGEGRCFGGFSVVWFAPMLEGELCHV